MKRHQSIIGYWMYWLLSQFDADNGLLVRDIIKKKALKQIQLPLSVEKEQGSCSQDLNNSSFEGIIVDLNVSLPASCCLSIMYYLFVGSVLGLSLQGWRAQCTTYIHNFCEPDQV